MEASLAAQRQELKDDNARLEARMDAGFNAVRSDITAIALAVGARSPRTSGQP